MQPFYASMCATLKAYPRHVAGRIIQQGGVTFLRDDVHRWYLPPEQVRTLLTAAERYWKSA